MKVATKTRIVVYLALTGYWAWQLAGVCLGETPSALTRIAMFISACTFLTYACDAYLKGSEW